MSIWDCLLFYIFKSKQSVFSFSSWNLSSLISLHVTSVSFILVYSLRTNFNICCNFFSIFIDHRLLFYTILSLFIKWKYHQVYIIHLVFYPLNSTSLPPIWILILRCNFFTIFKKMVSVFILNVFLSPEHLFCFILYITF